MSVIKRYQRFSFENQFNPFFLYELSPFQTCWMLFVYQYLLFVDSAAPRFPNLHTLQLILYKAYLPALVIGE